MEKETSIFLEVMGDYPVNRILDFLIVHEEFDYSMTDIAELSGVGYSTLKTFWPTLEKAGFVINTRAVGKAKMYQLNYKNSAVVRFKQFYWAVVKSKTVEALEILAKK